MQELVTDLTRMGSKGLFVYVACKEFPFWFLLRPEVVLGVSETELSSSSLL